MSGTESAADEEDLADWGKVERSLDQDDIDSLFGDSSHAEAPGPKRRGFEALIGNVVVGIERMPMLNIMVDRLAQLMTVGMRGFTGDNAEVTIDRIQACRLHDFLDAVSLPAMIAVIRVDPWDSYCLAALDPKLITSSMDVLLGGRRNRGAPIEGRPYTAIERTFVERLTHEVIARELKQAFELVADVDFVVERFETTPSYAAITKLSAAAVMFRAEVAMENRGGHIDFLIPYATFDPVREQLVEEFVGKKHGGDPIWRSHLSTVLPHAQVALRAVIEQRPATMAEVVKWRPGTNLVLDRRHDEAIDVYCDDLLVLRAGIAEKDGRLALRVEDRRLAHDWPETS